MPRIIRENLSCHRKKVRHPVFRKQCLTLGKIDWEQHFDTRFREAAARLFAVVEARSEVFFTFSPNVLRVETFIRMVEYREHWIRQPETWKPEPNCGPADEFFSLIDHLFVTYPMPAFFRKAWMQPGALRAPARDWFCQIAGGKNVRTLQNLPTKLSARAAHCAMSAPSHLTIEQSFRWGQVLAFGGSEELAAEIVRSRLGENFSGDRLWLKLVEKLAREPRFWAHEAAIVVDYIHFRILDGRGKLPDGFLKDKHIIEIAKQARAFWKQTAERAAHAHDDPRLVEFGIQGIRNQLLRMATHKWKPMDKVRPATLRGSDGAEWRITELCSELELQREGSWMHNCVATYSSWCQSGICSIWTVADSSGKHVATIRLYPELLELDETRAAFNRKPDHEVLRAVRTWARSNKIDDMWLDDEYDFSDRTQLELVV
jgi:hypothetical protein